MNFNLNIGGLIGALAGGAIAGLIVFTSLEAAASDQWRSTLFIAGVIVGAFAGNYLWELVFKKPK